MDGQRNKLQEDARLRILHLLQENRELSQLDPAKAVGSSVSRIHDMHNTLIETGLVKLENFTTAEEKRRYAHSGDSQSSMMLATATLRCWPWRAGEVSRLKRPGNYSSPRRCAGAAVA
jgi:hypothetical protein